MAKSNRLPNGAAIPLLMALIAVEQDECSIWHHASACGGYPAIRVDGKDRRGHVIACEIAHGPRPEGMVAAHSCGVRACVNPRHLRWATYSENIADMRIHGTMPSGNSHSEARLKPHEVIQIRAMYKRGEYSKAHLSRMFNVTPRIIRLIVQGQSWKHLPM